ncbi:bacterial Ig-like domain-containing protein [Enterococcus faecium]|uniref:bacterial Ig-like domain-containing protein n=1 Tax=Enterococcus faecium TaxID=1352 RepID=UPI001D175E47|nr:bacterial Ig-like domain-containing protein [Enterococcus faecium]MCC4051987.1 bacterial Ig-like domain-containing protein [Enterococcus faecium]
MCSKRRSKQLNKHACRLDKERSCSEKHYVKFMMRTMLISLSVGVYMNVPVQATAQTIKVVRTSVSETTDSSIAITHTFTDANGKQLLPALTSYNKVSYPPTINHYWLIPNKTLWTSETGSSVPLSIFSDMTDPTKGDQLKQITDILNHALTDVKDGGSAQVSYVYGKDYSQFEGKKIDVLAGTKVSISDLVERLKNADGTQGDMSKVISNNGNIVDTTNTGTSTISLSYFDPIALKTMTAFAVIHVRTDQTAIKGKDLHLRTGESYATKDLVEYVTKSDGTSENKEEIKMNGTVDTTTPGEYPVVLTYIDSKTSNVAETTAVVYVEASAASSTVITHFIDSQTNKELQAETHMSSVNRIPNLRLPAEFSDRVPNIDLSTYEQDGKVTSISDWMQANGLDRKSHWSEILEVLHSELMNNRKQSGGEITFTYVYIPNNRSLEGHDLIVHPNEKINKEELIQSATNSLGKPVPLKDVSVTINEVPLEDGYLTKQTGDFTIMYSYHDPYSLQELHAQSLLHVLPLNKQIDQKEQKRQKESLSEKKQQMAHAVSPTGKVKQTRSLELARISRKISESNKTIRQEAHLAPQVSGLENEILEPKIKQQSEKEFVAKQSEDQKESDDQKETKKKRLSTIDSTDEHLQPQVPLPSPGTPAPGGGIPSSALGDFMRGMAGTWVYANRNEFDADDWF